MSGLRKTRIGKTGNRRFNASAAINPALPPPRTTMLRIACSWGDIADRFDFRLMPRREETALRSRALSALRRKQREELATRHPESRNKARHSHAFAEQGVDRAGDAAQPANTRRRRIRE